MKQQRDTYAQIINAMKDVPIHMSGISMTHDEQLLMCMFIVSFCILNIRSDCLSSRTPGRQNKPLLVSLLARHKLSKTKLQGLLVLSLVRCPDTPQFDIIIKNLSLEKRVWCVVRPQ